MCKVPVSIISPKVNDSETDRNTEIDKDTEARDRADVHQDVHQSDLYRGGEIRVRLQPDAAGILWSGSYSFFTGSITQRSSDRVHGSLSGKFATQEEAGEAGFAEARLSVDREIRVAEITTNRKAK